LPDVVIIQEGCLEGGGRVEAVGTQDIGNVAIEAFDHAVGLWGSGLDEAVFDVVIGVWHARMARSSTLCNHPGPNR